MSNNKRNWGKEIKDVGTLLTIVGAVMLGMVIFALGAGDIDNIICIIVNQCDTFLIIGGALSLVVGLIIRNAGKSKENKFNAK